MSFIPRATFPALESLPRTYFLGHHKVALDRMQTVLSDVHLIIECRDYRIPITSRNPLLESKLAGRERLIVHTKRDLGSTNSPKDVEREKLIQSFYHPSTVLSISSTSKSDTRRVLDVVRQRAEASRSLTGTRLLVVGMPNVGKSTLLNALRREGTGRSKAAATGDQPGVTRSLSTGVKIIDETPESEPVYLMDTPGVFVPFMPNSESMIKLALCGCIKDVVISPIIVADYLLYRMNLVDPAVYRKYSDPTNDIQELLERVARKTGRLKPKGLPDLEASALWLIQQWRNGHLGVFVLDDVSSSAFLQKDKEEGSMSMKRARLLERQSRSRPVDVPIAR